MIQFKPIIQITLIGLDLILHNQTYIIYVYKFSLSRQVLDKGDETQGKLYLRMLLLQFQI